VSTYGRRSISLRLLAGLGCVLVLSPLTGCASASPSGPTSATRHFTFGHVQDRTGTGLYRVGSTAAGTATDTDSSLSIVLTVTGTSRVTVHPNATVVFANSTVHCFANGTSPHDPVSLQTGTTSVVLRCEEPFLTPAKILSVSITDGDA
jgi:hypothetical protein